MRRPRTFFNTILGVVIAAGCSSQPVGPSEPQSSPALGLANLEIANCPAPPMVRTSKAIGPNGGTLQIGPHLLQVPAGALRTTVTITAVTGWRPGNAIEFGPAGLRFRYPARLTMSTANCNGLGWLHLPVIVYTDDRLNILDAEVSLPNLMAKTVTAWLDHFSQYAVAF